IGRQLLNTTQGDGALEHLRKALALRIELTQEQLENKDFQFELGETHAALATAMAHRGDNAGALEQRAATLKICENLAAKYPQEQRYRRGMWISHSNIANLRSAQGDIAGAIKENDEAIALGEALVREDPLNADNLRNLVRDYQQG